MSVYIGAATKDDYSAMRGPCPKGFHVGTKSEWGLIINSGVAFSAWNTTGGANFSTYLKMPAGGYRTGEGASVSGSNDMGYYWTCTQYNSTYNTYSNYGLYFRNSNGLSSISVSSRNGCMGAMIRGIKDVPVEPDSSWTTLISSGEDGIYHSATLGLISMVYSGFVYTIADKNVGATTVYNFNDTLSEANCGKFFQMGNNYPFPYSGTVTTSSTQVSASNYGPGNYYSSSTFITGSSGWDSSQNKNLRGGETGIQQSPKELKSAYIGYYFTPVAESIAYEMIANSSGNLYVPKAGYTTSGSQSASYNWKVSVNGGTPTTYSGSASSGGSITLSGYTSGKTYTIVITPTTEDYGWARAYCWKGVSSRTNLVRVIYDGSYMGYATSATDTGDYFRAYQYYGCETLTKTPEEVMPDTVTTIGSYFRYYQYYDCSGLTSISDEALSNSVTTIGDRFRQNIYYNCSAITAPATEVLPNTVTTIGDYFRSNQYYNCTALLTPATEVLHSSVTSLGVYFRFCQYDGCSALTAATAEVFPLSITSIPSGFRFSQYYGCSTITTPVAEVIPSGVTSIGDRYRMYMYDRCTSLTTTTPEVLPNTVTTIGEEFRRAQYSDTNITTPAVEVLPSSVTTIGRFFRFEQYNGCAALTTTAAEVMSNNVTIIYSYFRGKQYCDCTSLTSTAAEVIPSYVATMYNDFRENQYSGCTNLTTITGWKDPTGYTNVSLTNYRNGQFGGCTSNKIVTVVGTVGSNATSTTLDNAYVTQVRVPSSYLSTYKNTSNLPWANITDSKFTGY